MVDGIDERFFSKLTTGANIFEGTPCLLWTGAPNAGGYGRFFPTKPEHYLAHRYAWMRFHDLDTIPDRDDNGNRLVIDHRCHNAAMDCKAGSECLHRRCVNPLHLRLVTQHENVFATGSQFPPLKFKNATHCIRGHALDADNADVWRNDWRICRKCRTFRNRRYGRVDKRFNSDTSRPLRECDRCGRSFLVRPSGKLWRHVCEPMSMYGGSE